MVKHEMQPIHSLKYVSSVSHSRSKIQPQTSISTDRTANFTNLSSLHSASGNQRTVLPTFRDEYIKVEVGCNR